MKFSLWCMFGLQNLLLVFHKQDRRSGFFNLIIQQMIFWPRTAQKGTKTHVSGLYIQYMDLRWQTCTKAAVHMLWDWSNSTTNTCSLKMYKFTTGTKYLTNNLHTRIRDDGFTLTTARKLEAAALLVWKEESTSQSDRYVQAVQLIPSMSKLYSTPTMISA